MSVVLAGAKLALHTDNRRPRFGLLLGLAVARGGEQSNGVGRHLKLLLQLRRLHLDRPDLNVVPGAAPIRNVSRCFRCGCEGMGARWVCAGGTHHCRRPASPPASRSEGGACLGRKSLGLSPASAAPPPPPVGSRWSRKSRSLSHESPSVAAEPSAPPAMPDADCDSSCSNCAVHHNQSACQFVVEKKDDLKQRDAAHP